MTKTLTEQWKEGRLKGWHYLTDYNGKEVFRYLTGVKPDADFIKCFEEVLAPVPSFDEYKELVRKSDKLDKIMSDTVTNQGDCQQIVEDNLNRELSRKTLQLEIATKALKEYADKDKWEHCSPDWRDAEEALKEMEGVK